MPREEKESPALVSLMLAYNTKSPEVAQARAYAENIDQKRIAENNDRPRLFGGK